MTKNRLAVGVFSLCLSLNISAPLVFGQTTRTTPPVITNNGPTTVTFPTPVILNIKTDEPATCRYYMSPSPPGAPSSGLSYNDPSRITFASDTIPTTVHGPQYVGTYNAGYTYAFIKCMDAFGNVSTTDFIVSFFIQPPAPLPTPTVPQNLKATVLDPTHIQLSWSASTVTSPSSPSILYNVFRLQQPGTAYTQVYGLINATTWTDGASGTAPVSPGQTYQFYLTAMNVGGPIPSSPSGPSSVVTVTIPPVRTTPPVITNNGSTTIVFPAPVILNIKTDELATCRYYMSPSPPGAPSSGVSYTDPSRTTFATDTVPVTTHGPQYIGTLSPNTYTYAFIKCRDIYGNVSPTDSIVSFFIQGPAPLPTPSVPQNVTAIALDPTHIQLNWNASTVTSPGSPSILYNVFRLQQPGTAYTQVYGLINATTWTDGASGTAPVSPGQTYQFYLTAMNVGGPIPSSPSGRSAIVTVTTPGLPTGEFIINAGDATTASNNVMLNFVASAGVTAVKIVNDVPPANWSTVPDVPYADPMEADWTLSNGGGQKTVYVRFKDGNGYLSNVYSSHIFFVGPDPSLIAQYQFSSDVTDFTGKGHDGQGQGSLDYDYMPNGNYYAAFNGTDSYVQVQSTPDLNLNAYTVSFWVKPSYQNYGGQKYAVLSKGTGINKELYFEIDGQSKGFGIIPGQGDTPLVNAPTNLAVLDGGFSTTGKRILYISWQNNDINAAGVEVDISDPGVACGVSCANSLSPTVGTFEAYIDPASTVKNISVHAINGSNLSSSVSAQVTIAAQTITVVPLADGSAAGYIPLDNQWHHVARSWDLSGTTKYYIDGQLVFTGTSTVGPHGNDPLLIGAASQSAVVPSSTAQQLDGSALISWNSIVGKNYEVQYSVDGQNWHGLGNMTAQDATSSMDDPNYQAGYSYQVLQLGDNIFNGGLDHVSIYGRVLSGAEVSQKYMDEKNGNFRQIDMTYVNLPLFQTLSEPQYSQAMIDLENLSRQYSSAFSLNMPINNDLGETSALLQRRWEAQEQFLIDQLRLMDKYGLLSQYNETADQVLATMQPIWQAEEEQQGFQAFLPSIAAASSLKVQSNLKTASVMTTATATTTTTKQAAYAKNVLSGTHDQMVAAAKKLLHIPTQTTSKAKKVKFSSLSKTVSKTAGPVALSGGAQPMDGPGGGGTNACDVPINLFPCAGGPATTMFFTGPTFFAPDSVTGIMTDTHLPISVTSLVFDNYLVPDTGGFCTKKLSLLTLQGTANAATPTLLGPTGLADDTNTYKINQSTNWYNIVSSSWTDIDTYTGLSDHNTGERLLNVRGERAPLSFDLYSPVMKYTHSSCLGTSLDLGDNNQTAAFPYYKLGDPVCTGSTWDRIWMRIKGMGGTTLAYDDDSNPGWSQSIGDAFEKGSVSHCTFEVVSWGRAHVRVGKDVMKTLLLNELGLPEIANQKYKHDMEIDGFIQIDIGH